MAPRTSSSAMFRKMLRKMLRLHEIVWEDGKEDGRRKKGIRRGRLGVPRNEYNGDNGAMIAYTGFLLQKKYGNRAVISVDEAVPNTRWRIDQVLLV